MKGERRNFRAEGKPKKILRSIVSDSGFTAFIFPLLVCQNFPATKMISQARCVLVCTAALGATLLGVVDEDNIALWLKVTTTESAAEACSTSGRKREGRLLLSAAC